MAYVTNLDIVSATSEGLIVAAQASVPEASAATVTVLNGGTASNCVVSTGGGLRTWAADGTGLLDTVTVYDGTLFVRSAGNTGRNLTFSGGTGYLQDGATMTDVNIYGGTLSAYTGTLENAKLYGGNLYAIFDSTGMVFSNTTVYGGTFIVRKLNNSAVDVTLSGGVAHLQSATMTNVGVYNGAELILESGWLNRATVYAGGKLTGNTNNIGTVNFNDLTVKAGGSTTLTYNFLLTGETNIEEGAYIYLGNTNNPAAGVTAKDGVIDNLTTLFNGSFGSGVTLTNLRVTGGTTNINSGAVVDGGTVVNGNLQALDAAGGGVISGVTMSAGTLIVRSAGNSAVDFTLSNGIAHLQDDATMTDVNIYGGTLSAYTGT
ncbi:MAG: hypothetical protein IJJ28_01955, partial [Lentisphaeria bacterium]|nr:hypothetical protein [Lentisphaeria bacterium]